MCTLGHPPLPPSLPLSTPDELWGELRSSSDCIADKEIEKRVSAYPFILPSKWSRYDFRVYTTQPFSVTLHRLSHNLSFSPFITSHLSVRAASPFSLYASVLITHTHTSTSPFLQFFAVCTRKICNIMLIFYFWFFTVDPNKYRRRKQREIVL